MRELPVAPALAVKTGDVVPQVVARIVAARAERDVRSIVAIEAHTDRPGHTMLAALIDEGEIGHLDFRISFAREIADNFTIAAKYPAAANETVIDAVGDIARVTFGGDEVDRVAAVAREAQIRPTRFAVRANRVEQASAVLPGVAVVVAGDVMRVVRVAAKEA